jgi:hypothetical protein
MLLVASIPIFRINRAAMYFGYDGTYAWQLAKYNREWSGAFAGTELNPLTGLGDIKYAMNFWCSLPTIISYLFSGPSPDAALIYALTGAEFFASVWFLCRSLELGQFSTVLASWLAVVLAFPFFLPIAHGLKGFFNLSGASPAMIEFLAICTLIIALTLRIKISRVKQNILLGLCVIGLIYLLVFEFPTQFTLAVPVLLACVLYSVVTLCHGRSQIRTAVICAAVFGMTLFFPAVFVVGMVLWSPPAFFAKELSNTGVSHWKFVSMLSHGPLNLGWANTIIYLLAWSGAIIALRTGSRVLRGAAIIFTSLAGSILLFGLTVTFVLSSYKGVFAQYLEWPIWSLMFVFTAVCMDSALGRFMSGGSSLLPGARSFLKDRAFPALCGVSGTICIPILVLGCVLLYNRPEQTQDYPKPPGYTEIVGSLHDSIGLNPGDSWRGCVANFCTERRPVPGIEWDQQRGFDQTFWRSTGNDHRGAGLWWYNIPTLFCYHQCMSPSTYYFVSRMFASPEDRQTRNVTVVSNPDLKMLALAGVRYLLSDIPLQGEGVTPPVGLFPWRLLDGDADLSVYLYDVPGSNTRGFSPTEPILVPKARPAIDTMRSAAFDPVRQVVVHKPLDKLLSAARESTMTWKRGGELQVTAQSDGWSLIVLPLGYSTCLRMLDHAKGRSSVGAPTLLRVDASLTAILFERHLDVSIRQSYGPFINPFGRIKDYIEFGGFLKGI